MPSYPDWIIALDHVAKGEAGAEITKRNAKDIIDELTRLKGQVKALTTPEADRTAADGGAVFAAHLSQWSR